ncbi:MAG: hypothetical protein LUQ01_05935 [Methanolinea sp.]|nr:hypothetical protein [Methanolinea sp.]
MFSPSEIVTEIESRRVFPSFTTVTFRNSRRGSGSAVSDSGIHLRGRDTTVLPDASEIQYKSCRDIL